MSAGQLPQWMRSSGKSTAICPDIYRQNRSLTNRLHPVFWNAAPLPVWCSETLVNEGPDGGRDRD